jgi:hypothetical protein
MGDLRRNAGSAFDVHGVGGKLADERPGDDDSIGLDDAGQRCILRHTQLMSDDSTLDGAANEEIATGDDVTFYLDIGAQYRRHVFVLIPARGSPPAAAALSEHPFLPCPFALLVEPVCFSRAGPRPYCVAPTRITLSPAPRNLAGSTGVPSITTS